MMKLFDPVKSKLFLEYDINFLILIVIFSMLLRNQALETYAQKYFELSLKIIRFESTYKCFWGLRGIASFEYLLLRVEC